VGDEKQPPFFFRSLLSGCSPFVSLQTIPPNGTGDFDVDRFVLKIMSVDHQAKSGDSGVFGEDTQVVFSDHLEGVWCYVHHLTLLDIHARGTHGFG
jgi:hypothetical protein